MPTKTKLPKWATRWAKPTEKCAECGARLVVYVATYSDKKGNPVELLVCVASGWMPQNEATAGDPGAPVNPTGKKAA